MHRRSFLLSSLALSASTALGSPIQPVMNDSTSSAANSAAPAATPGTREFYQLRRYQLFNGPQVALTEHHFAESLVPALNRLGHSPVGAFRLEIGPETPAFYLLVPGSSAEALALLDQSLAADEQFLRSSEAFWAAPATAPAFLRVESSLFSAFKGWPKLTPPPESSTKSKRIFQLRTYESPSYRDHIRKMEMFNHGEFEIFRNAGFHQVFYGDALIGGRIPNLTYMLSAPDQASLDASWRRFGADPAWQKLSHDPRYAFEEIVSNITNLILSPLACSQI